MTQRLIEHSLQLNVEKRWVRRAEARSGAKQTCRTVCGMEGSLGTERGGGRPHTSHEGPALGRQGSIVDGEAVTGK